MWRVIKNKKGYTIVELVVVMAIIAILMPLSWSGYDRTRKQQYTKHVANTAQLVIRDTFIDTISTKVESGGNCMGKSPQINIVKIQLSPSLNTYPLLRNAVCVNASNSNVLGSMDLVEIIDPSKNINYKQAVELTCKGCDSGNQSALVKSGFLYIAFTSPYGKYYSFYSSNGNATVADSEFMGLGWTKGGDLIYSPPLTAVLGNPLEIYFDSDVTVGQEGIVHKISISKEGNVSLD